MIPDARVGRIDPIIDRVAKRLSAAGWRITSIYRFDDASRHGRGEAVDIAPWVAHQGPGFFTAALARRIATQLRRRGFPPLRVVSEIDHVHVELSRSGLWTYGTFINNRLIESPLE